MGGLRSSNLMTNGPSSISPPFVADPSQTSTNDLVKFSRTAYRSIQRGSSNWHHSRSKFYLQAADVVHPTPIPAMLSPAPLRCKHNSPKGHLQGRIVIHFWEVGTKKEKNAKGLK